MNTLTRSILKDSIEPMIYLIGLTFLMSTWWVLDWPPADEVFNTLILQLRTQGTQVLIIASFLEGLAIINLYVPGSVVVAAAIIASRDDPQLTIWFAGICYSMFVLAGITNYLIGRVAGGWLARCIDNQIGFKNPHPTECFAPQIAKIFRVLGGALSMIHPNLAAVGQIRAGRRGGAFFKTLALMLCGYFVSVTFWTTMTLVFTSEIKALATKPLIIFSIVMIWLFLSIFWSYRTYKKCNV